jgi:hypothetical protein
LCTSAARLLRAVVSFCGGLRANIAADSDSASCTVTASPVNNRSGSTGNRSLRSAKKDETSLGLSESSVSSRFRLLLRLLVLVGSVVAVVVPKQ